MLKRITISNLTFFSHVSLEFKDSHDVIVGEKEASKTNLLKMIYSALIVSGKEAHKSNVQISEKSTLRTCYVDKLIDVFKVVRHCIHRHLVMFKCNFYIKINGFTNHQCL